MGGPKQLCSARFRSTPNIRVRKYMRVTDSQPHALHISPMMTTMCVCRIGGYSIEADRKKKADSWHKEALDARCAHRHPESHSDLVQCELVEGPPSLACAPPSSNVGCCSKQWLQANSCRQARILVFAR